MGYGDDMMALGEMMELLKDLKKENSMVAVGGKYYESPIYLHHPLLLPPDERVIAKYKSSGIGVIHFNWNKRKRHGNFYMKKGFKDVAKNLRIISTQEYKPKIADIYFRDEEIERGNSILKSNKIKKFIFIQPLIKDGSRINKNWGRKNYKKLISMLSKDYKLVSCRPKGSPPIDMPGLLEIETENIRDAIVIMSKASAFVGNEGAMHHAAASLNIPGCVIFGHFISPNSTGYEIHKNYFFDDGTEENKYGCGIWGRECETCSFAMNSFTPKMVYSDLMKILSKKPPKKRIFINPDNNYGYMTEKTYGKIWLSRKYRLAAKKNKEFKKKKKKK